MSWIIVITTRQDFEVSWCPSAMANIITVCRVLHLCFIVVHWRRLTFFLRHFVLLFSDTRLSSLHAYLKREMRFIYKHDIVVLFTPYNMWV